MAGHTPRRLRRTQPQGRGPQREAHPAARAAVSALVGFAAYLVTVYAADSLALAVVLGVLALVVVMLLLGAVPWFRGD